VLGLFAAVERLEVAVVGPQRGHRGVLEHLGIATVSDRVAQGALKLVLEPVFEVDFEPCS